MIVFEWIIIGFFSAIGWKGADYMFEKIGTGPTQIVRKEEKLCELPKLQENTQENQCVTK